MMSDRMKPQSQSQPLDEDLRLAILARRRAEAFAELYCRHVTRVYRYHVAHTGNPKDAEDLTSQTFMAALEGIHSFRADGSFAAWIMGIAVRKRALFFRRRRPELPLEAAGDLPSADPPADQAAHQRLQLEAVRRALARLSPDRAEALILHFFGGLSGPEVSRVLGKSEAAVKMLLARGLQDLRERTSLLLEVEP
jgi:RNA polymerase sigma-70 factor (ECF subfamily)